MAKKKKKYRLKKSGLAIIIGFLLLVTALGTYLFFREKSRDFVYKKHLNETAITIDGEDIPLKQMNFYIYKVEKQINEMAITYNPNNPKEFWQTYFKSQLDSTFTRDYAKELAKEICVYDYVMLKEAQEYEISLTPAEIAAADEEAQDYYDGMSAYAIKQTEITVEELKPIFENEAILRKYITRAAVDITAQGYTGNVSEQLIYTGDYYKDKILAKYQVTYNEELWGKITMGTITLE